MVQDIPTIGIRFDIAKVGGGYYGYTCWKIFWQAVYPIEIGPSVLYEGDTATTGSGKENVTCLAIQSLRPDIIETIKTVLSKFKGFQDVCAAPMFVEDDACWSEPLVEVGKIDNWGNTLGDETEPALRCLNEIKKERQSKGTETSEPHIKTSSIKDSTTRKKWWHFWK